MKCPNCGYLGSMSDCGDFPGAISGLRCPQCDECIPDEDLEYEPEPPDEPDGDVCDHCGSRNTERIDTVSDDPVIWFVQCGSCGETFEVVEPIESQQNISSS